MPVDIDRETVVADQRGEVITLVRGDGLIKFNSDGITRRFGPAGCGLGWDCIEASLEVGELRLSCLEIVSGLI